MMITFLLLTERTNYVRMAIWDYEMFAIVIQARWYATQQRTKINYSGQKLLGHLEQWEKKEKLFKTKKEMITGTIFFLYELIQIFLTNAQTKKCSSLNSTTFKPRSEVSNLL